MTEDYAATAATILAMHGAKALPLVQEAARQAVIDCDAEEAAFWRLVMGAIVVLRPG